MSENSDKGHNGKICPSRKYCKVCNGKHVTTLHDYLEKKTAINSDKGLNNDGKNESVKVSLINTGTDVVSMSVDRQLLPRQIDTCSQGTFILKTLINYLTVKGQRTSIIIKTLSGEVTNKAMVVKRLTVTSYNSDSHDWLELPDTYTKKYLPVDKGDAATPPELKQWEHLEILLGKSVKRKTFLVGY